VLLDRRVGETLQQLLNEGRDVNGLHQRENPYWPTALNRTHVWVSIAMAAGASGFLALSHLSETLCWTRLLVYWALNHPLGSPQAHKRFMAVPTDLRTLCSALEHFHFPAALGSVNNNRLMIWNEPFRQMAELSERELAEVNLSSLIVLDENYDGSLLQDGDSKRTVRFVPCVLKRFGRTKPTPGSAVRRDDGLLLVILNLPASGLESQDLVRGRLLGREEEKNRTRQLLHDIFSSRLLVASFTAHEVYQKLVASGAEGSKELAMVTKLLGEVIDAITCGFGESPTEPMPDLEAASRQRLQGFRDP
jgi:hypothetical protein